MKLGDRYGLLLKCGPSICGKAHNQIWQRRKSGRTEFHSGIRFCPTPPNSTNSITNCSRREQETASPSSPEETEQQRDMEAMAYMSSSIDGLDWDD